MIAGVDRRVISTLSRLDFVIALGSRIGYANPLTCNSLIHTMLMRVACKTMGDAAR